MADSTAGLSCWLQQDPTARNGLVIAAGQANGSASAETGPLANWYPEQMPFATRASRSRGGPSPTLKSASR